MRDRLEVPDARIHHWKRLGRPRARVKPVEIRLHVHAPTWDHRVVRAIIEKPQPCRARAPVHSRELQRADAQLRLQPSSVVTNAHFREPVERMSNAYADIRAVDRKSVV